MIKDKIILVEDDPVLGKLTKDMLNMIKVECLVARTLEEAVSLFTSAILDMHLEESTGVEVLSELRKIEPALVAILSSGAYITAEEDKYFEMGFKEIIQKPYRMKILQDMVKKYLTL